MTEVAFHFNATDKLEYACRLLRKAVANSAQVVVTGGDRDCLESGVCGANGGSGRSLPADSGAGARSLAHRQVQGDSGCRGGACKWSWSVIKSR